MLLLDDLFSEVLLPINFQKRKKSWFRFFPEIIQVINLQKSDYGNSFYLNIGVSPTELCSDKFIPINKTHLFLRYEDISQDPDSVKSIFDFEDFSISEQKREEHIRSVLKDCEIFLKNMTDVKSLREMILSSKKLKNRSVADLRTFLSL